MQFRKVLIGSFMVLAASAQHGDFTVDCLSYELEVNGNMKGKYSGDCSSDPHDGDYHQTYLDLNLCLYNQGGILIAKDHGGAMSSCNCVSLRGHTDLLNCTCLDVKGSPKPAAIDLKSVLYFDEGRGVLGCFDNYGTKE